MDMMEGTALAMLAASQGARDKLLIVGFGVLSIGFLMGVLISFIFISMPMTETYNIQMAKITENGSLSCYNTKGMANPAVVEFNNLREYCDNMYVLDRTRANLSDQLGTNFPFMKINKTIGGK
jgi:hypothetical protein